MKFLFPAALLVLLAPSVLAHGVGQRIDLPLPLPLYLGGAAAVVAASFAFVVFSGRSFFRGGYPSFNLSRLRAFRALQSAPFVFAVRAFFLLLFFLTVAAGFLGSQTPVFNVAPVLVWVCFAVGLTFFVAVFGNVWEIVNPVRSLHELLSWGVRLPSGKELGHLARYPSWLGAWPAVAFYFFYRWVENALERSSEPAVLSVLIVSYAAFSLLAMTVFGREAWLRNADPFSVLFRLLSLFSVTERRGGSVYLRPPAVGILREGGQRLSVTVFVLLMMASLTWDGLKETVFWRDNFSAFSAGYSVNALGILLALAVFLAVYLLFCNASKRAASSGDSAVAVGNRFVLTLLPIAIAYEAAHFLVFFLTEGQRVFYLASDPLGLGWNLFGTAGYSVNYGVVNFQAAWLFQVFLIVAAHVAAVCLAHAAALRRFPDGKKALRSQYPMILLMVLYAVLSLWILAQPLTAG